MGNGAHAGSNPETGNPTHSKQFSEIRIALIGKTGTGKSTIGNAILGSKKFRTEGLQMESTTVSFEVGTAEDHHIKISVLDTPGAMGTNRVQPNLQEELPKFTFDYLRPGPHVFLLTIRADAKFTEEEANAVKIFTDLFGEALYSHLIVVFTHKSALDKNNKTVDDCLRKLPDDFIAKFHKYKGRYIAIEAEGEMKHVKKQVTKLLKVVEEVVYENMGNCYSAEMMKEDEEACMVRIAKNKEVKEIIENNKRKEEETNNQRFKTRAKNIFVKGADVIVDVIADGMDDSS